MSYAVVKYKPVIHEYGQGWVERCGGNGGQYQTLDLLPKKDH